MKKGYILCYKKETDIKYSTYYSIAKGNFLEKTGNDLDNE